MSEEVKMAYLKKYEVNTKLNKKEDGETEEYKTNV
jgi:hypothetical protein